jgi:hypothetical protein
MFESIDEDGSGIIDLHELRLGLSRMERLPTRGLEDDEEFEALLIGRGLPTQRMTFQDFRRLIHEELEQYELRSIDRALTDDRVEEKVNTALRALGEVVTSTRTLRLLQRRLVGLAPRLASLERSAPWSIPLAPEAQLANNLQLPQHSNEEPSAKCGEPRTEPGLAARPQCPGMEVEPEPYNRPPATNDAGTNGVGRRRATNGTIAAPLAVSLTYRDDIVSERGQIEKSDAAGMSKEVAAVYRKERPAGDVGKRAAAGTLPLLSATAGTQLDRGSAVDGGDSTAGMRRVPPHPPLTDPASPAEKEGIQARGRPLSTSSSPAADPPSPATAIRASLTLVPLPLHPPATVRSPETAGGGEPRDPASPATAGGGGAPRVDLLHRRAGSLRLMPLPLPPALPGPPKTATRPNAPTAPD